MAQGSRGDSKKRGNRNRPARAPRRREADVLKAAANVFYERGYSNATVQDVADELGILKGSLYHYIDTKEDLLFQLIEEVHLQVQQILTEVEEEEDLDPRERLKLYVQRQVEYNIANLERISIYYHDLNRLTGDRLVQVKALRRVHEEYVASIISAAQKEGTADKSFDARLLANCLFSTIIWTYQWYRQGKMSRKAVTEVCMHYALNGISPTR